MIDKIMYLNPLIGIITSIIIAIAIGLITYLLGRLLFAKHINQGVENAGVLLYRSVGLLLGLMLSINFVDTRSQYVKVQDSVELGAKEIHEVLLDLERFGSNESNQIIRKCIEYLDAVINDEWPKLAESRLSEKAWRLFYEIENDILDLLPDSAYQKEIKNRIVKDIDELSDHRHMRLNAGNVNMNWFLTVVIIIFAVSTFLYSVNTLRIPVLIFIATYSMVIGIVIFSIMSLNRPYQGLVSVSVQPLKAVYNEFVSNPKFNKILSDAPNDSAN